MLRDEARELGIRDRAHADIDGEAGRVAFPDGAVLAEPDDQLFEHDAIEIGIGARVVHVLQHAIGRDAELIVGVRIAHQHFETARAAAALELHQLLDVQLENLAVELELAGARRDLRRFVDVLRLDVHVAVGLGQRFDFGGLFFAFRFGVHGLELDLRRGLLILDQLGNRLGFEFQFELRQAIGLDHAQVGTFGSQAPGARRLSAATSDRCRRFRKRSCRKSELLGTLLPKRALQAARAWPRRGWRSGPRAQAARPWAAAPGFGGSCRTGGRRLTRACGAAGRCAGGAPGRAGAGGTPGRVAGSRCRRRRRVAAAAPWAAD